MQLGFVDFHLQMATRLFVKERRTRVAKLELYGLAFIEGERRAACCVVKCTELTEKFAGMSSDFAVCPCVLLQHQILFIIDCINSISAGVAYRIPSVSSSPSDSFSIKAEGVFYLASGLFVTLFVVDLPCSNPQSKSICF